MKFIDEIKQIYNKSIKEQKIQLEEATKLEMVLIKTEFEQTIKDAAKAGIPVCYFTVNSSERKNALHTLAKEYGLKSENYSKPVSFSGSSGQVVVSGWDDNGLIV